MEQQQMKKEQIIAQIENLTKEIAALKIAEKKHERTENLLRKSDEKFRFLFDTAPIGLSISNAEGKIISANSTLQELLGYTMEELKGMNFVQFYTDKDERKRLLDKLYESNHVRDFETVFTNKQGVSWNVLINSDYIGLDNERVLLTSFHDLTGLKNAQAELKQSEARYHTLFSNAPIGITVTDFQGYFHATNQAIQDLLGYTSEELSKMKISEFYEDKQARDNLIERTRQEGIVRDFETVFTDRNGRRFSVLINTDLIHMEEEQMVLLTSIRDISGLKKFEDELKRERDFNRAILNTTDSLIAVIDLEGRIVTFNHSCEKITGYTISEIKGKFLWELLTSEKEETKEAISKMLGGEYPYIYETYFKTKTGEDRVVSWTGTVINRTDGKADYLMSTGIDITESRKAKQALQEANEKLAEWIKALEERSEEMSRLSEMGGQLQLCQTVEEVCSISAQYIRMICNKSRGAIYLINPSKDLAEAMQIWGEPVNTEKVFLPSKCWATRKSRIHRIDSAHPGLKCEHITGPDEGQYICIPMMAQGEILGILHLNHDAFSAEDLNLKETLYNDHKIQLVNSIAEHIALALTNLRLRETLRQQSIRDVLTGLYNRRYMEETLSREIIRAQRENREVGVIMFDIDHFKEFNDLAGHDGGDALLKELGSLLLKNFRGGDIVCRYGGEEFFVVLPSADLQSTKEKAENLRKSVKELMVYHLGKPLGKCTISLGVAAYPKNGSTNEALIKSADIALYEAKESGRDRVVVCTD